MEKMMKLMQLTVKDDHLETEVFEAGSPQKIATSILLLMKQHLCDYHDEDFIWNVHLYSFYQRTKMPSPITLNNGIFSLEIKNGYSLLSSTNVFNNEQYAYILGCFMAYGISYSIECYIINILYRFIYNEKIPH